jgi:hypothetical protein
MGFLTIFSKTYPSFYTFNQGIFLKSTRPSFIDKAGCTRQFESELSLRSLASLFPIKEGSTSLLGLLQ